jgi:hypothetical protein
MDQLPRFVLERSQVGQRRLASASALLLAFLFASGAQAGGPQTTDDLPILFTKVPSNAVHGSSHCEVATLIAHPLSATNRVIKPFNAGALPSSTTQVGTAYQGWLGDGQTAVVEKITYRVSVNDADCSGRSPPSNIIEPFVVNPDTGSVIARPTLVQDDQDDQPNLIPSADGYSGYCWYYREQLIVSPFSKTKANNALWFLATRFAPATERHCTHLTQTDRYLGGVKADKYNNWHTDYQKPTGVWYRIGVHGCEIAPNGNAWACEGDDAGLHAGPVLGTLGPAITPATGLNYAVWRPNSQGFVYMAYSFGPGVHNPAQLVYVPVDTRDPNKIVVGKTQSLAPSYPPAEICSSTVGNGGVSCNDYAGSSTGGAIGSDIPKWSRDSKWVYFSGLVSQTGSNKFHRVLLRVSPESPQGEVLTDQWTREAGHPAMSPSGGYVAFLSNRADNNKLVDVFLLDVRTHQVQQLTNINDDKFQAYNPVWWTPDADLFTIRGQ